MKVTDVKLHVLKEETPALVTSFDGLFHDSGRAGQIQYSLVRVLTDEGVEGDYLMWSEMAAARPGALAAALAAMKPMLVGEDPLHRERIWQRLGCLWYGQKGPALAALDIALWDIAGKSVGLPIYKLLGAYRDKIPAYASGNVPHTSDRVVPIAEALMEKGYRAMKLHPIPIEVCQDLRTAVGDDVELMFDAVFALSRRKALRVGRQLEELNYCWYEAPLPPDDVEGYVDLRQRLDVPLTVELTQQSQYREFVKRHAVDHLRTLSGMTDGITGMRKAAALCEMFGMQWEPHAYGGAHYQAANLHVLLATKNAAYFELPIEQGEEGHFDIGVTDTIRIDAKGFVHAPTTAGLGIEVDWERVSAGEEVPL